MKQNNKQSIGRLIGVGVGPGDPELLTLKAIRAIQNSPVVSYLTNAQGQSQALDIAQAALANLADVSANASLDLRTGKHNIGIYMPMKTERTAANQAYDKGAKAIAECLNTGQDVVFLCEGDPLFYGSFSYLLERLQGEFLCTVVPGITSVNAAAASVMQPLTMLKESFAVMNGRHSDADILHALAHHDSLVIMKAGQARVRILDLLAQSGRTQDAEYLEYIGRDNQQHILDVTLLERTAGPYFSLFMVTAKDKRLAGFNHVSKGDQHD